ncbi:MAG: aminotransferase class IV [Bacteroides sp.]|jgi:branched-chain amino acid aminotransferase|nr:aminotransferase class IV [Bacteroides sp.]
MPSKISFNGKLLDRDGFGLSLANRSFRYGDGLFETIRVENGKVLWAERHFQRLSKDSGLLKMELPSGYDQEKFARDILNLYRENHKEDEPARVRFALFRQEGGFYTPQLNGVDYLIETSPLKSAYYSLNKKGLLVDIFEDYYKSCHALSNIKSSSALVYVMAGIFCKEKGLDDCLLINDERLLAEATSSNLFLVKDKRIVTPSLDQACVEGVMRSVVIDLARSQGIGVEERPLESFELSDADEIFLTNAISGIQWVVGFREKRFYNKMARTLEGLLNRAARDYVLKHH